MEKVRCTVREANEGNDGDVGSERVGGRRDGGHANILARGAFNV